MCFATLQAPGKPYAWFRNWKNWTELTIMAVDVQFEIYRRQMMIITQLVRKTGLRAHGISDLDGTN